MFQLRGWLCLAACFLTISLQSKADSSVVFNEVMYHPSTNEALMEWVELQNQHAVDVDLSGWSLSGAVEFVFAEGTLLKGGELLVIASSPESLRSQTGLTTVLGPFSGRLGNGGQRLELRNNNERIIDRLDYGTDGDWPIAPDGTGPSLARIGSNLASADPRSWRASAEIGGTPGRVNFTPLPSNVVTTTLVSPAQTWRYQVAGNPSDLAWMSSQYDDSSWAVGQGVFHSGTQDLPWALNTLIPSSRNTLRFRTQFIFQSDPDPIFLQLRTLVDDGAVLFLNGQEITRLNLSTGVVEVATPALSRVGVPTVSPPLNLPSRLLHQGVNTLAVELHQASRSTPYPQTVLDSGPVAYWRLGEKGLRALDLSPRSGNQDGTYQKILSSNLGVSGVRPTNSIDSLFFNGFESNNAAARFAGNADGGNDVVLIPDPGAMNFAQRPEFSLEAWVNAAATQENGAAVIAKGSGGGGEQYAIDIQSGHYRFLVRKADEPATLIAIESQAGPDSSWQHVVATCAAGVGEMRLYVNGRLQSVGAAPATLFSTAHEVSLGARQQASTNYDLNLDGRLDEVAIYDRALSAVEVQAHFDAAFRTSDSPLNLQEDGVFGLELTSAEERPVEPSGGLFFNEVAPVGPEFWIEVGNSSREARSLVGWSIERWSTGTHDSVPMPDAPLEPGGLISVSLAELGIVPKTNDILALTHVTKGSVADAVRVDAKLRGRSPDLSGRWLYPSAPSPGGSNRFNFHRDLVINEIQYHPHPFPAQEPIVTNFLSQPLSAAWKYQASAQDLGSAWRESDYDDSLWASGGGVFHAPSTLSLPVSKGTPLTLASPTGARVVTAYFRSEFAYAGEMTNVQLVLSHVLDDGAIFYLNGTELYRTNMPSTNALYGTLATRNVGTIVKSDPILLPSAALRSGRNVLAVEVHQAATNSTDLAFGLEFGVTKTLADAVPFAESPEAWFEIFNRTDRVVPLEGWRVSGGVSFTFPKQSQIAPGGFAIVAKDVGFLRSLYPSLKVFGPFQGKLSAHSDQLTLVDPEGNPAHEVRYFGDGDWPSLADGGGSSLELKSAETDASAGIAWAASDERSKMPWTTYTWRGIAQPGQPGEPDLWHEFVTGLIDGAGEALLDDLHVVESPGGARKELIQNGSFDGGSAAHWRFLGTHRGSRVEADPSTPGNYILHLVASGPAEYQGNQIETTLAGNAAIVNGREYEISFRARWVAGAFRLNSRLYFNRLARTIPLPMPRLTGTPGAPNSARVTVPGPTFQHLTQFPIVPEPFQPTTFQVEAADRSGLGSVVLHYAVSTNEWKTVPMETFNGVVYQGRIPGLEPQSIVQVYVSGTNRLGGESFYPAGGAESRALFAVGGLQDSPLKNLHEFRLLMTAPDAAFLHKGTNTLSNELLGATVIYDRKEIFYDVHARLKGSFVGRNVPRVGFHVAFHDEKPFRGVHGVVSVDRSQHALTGGVAEILAKQIANHVGGVPDMYDDITQFVAPIPSYSIVAGLRMDGFDNDFLDSQWEQGANGPLYEVEVLRSNVATVDGKPESPKAVGNESGGTDYVNLELDDYGSNPEAYRWLCLQANRRTVDDYQAIIRASKVLGDTSSAFDGLSETYLDVNEWLRVMAYQQLVGPADAYFTGGAVHNFRVYVRPSDGRLLYLPWDWDSSFLAGSSASITGGGNIAKLLNAPARKRLFFQHLQEMLETSFNDNYVSRWASHFGALANQDFSEVLAYVKARAAFVRSQLPTAGAFAITTQGGSDFSTNQSPAVLTGTAPIQVNRFLVNGWPQSVTWTTPTQWRMLVDLAPGENLIQIQGLDRLGGSLSNAVAAIRIVNSGSGAPQPVVINEWMADNSSPGGIPDPLDGLFQDWFELYNPNAFAVDLSGYYLTDDFTQPTKWRIPPATSLQGEGYLLVWADGQPQQNGVGDDLHANFQLSSGGESIGLFAPDGVKPVSQVEFGGQIPNISQGRVPGTSGLRIGFLERSTPRRPNSVERALRITNVESTPSAARLSWIALPGAIYRVESTEDLNSATWKAVGTISGGRSGVAELSDPEGSNSSRFYRVVQLP